MFYLIIFEIIDNREQSYFLFFHVLLCFTLYCTQVITFVAILFLASFSLTLLLTLAMSYSSYILPYHNILHPYSLSYQSILSSSLLLVQSPHFVLTDFFPHILNLPSCLIHLFTHLIHSYIIHLSYFHFSSLDHTYYSFNSTFIII